MPKIPPLEVALWTEDYKQIAKYNLADTSAASISIDELLALSENKSVPNPLSTTTKLSYGPIHGSDKLRSNLAGLYSVKSLSPLPSSSIIITPGATAANFLAFYALVTAGDHVICHYPTSEQLYKVPASFGADVTLWKSNEAKGWALSVDELESVIQPGNTKLLVISNPHNPTGAILPAGLLQDVVNLCRQHSITILSDESHRPLFHGISPISEDFPSSALNLGYDNVVVTGSLSTAYSLAGIRVGWLATKNQDLTEAIAQCRNYINISVSQFDDAIAVLALGEDCIHGLLGRNISLARSNLQMLDDFVEAHRWACSWTKPVAGTTAFVKFAKMGKPVDDVAFCEALLRTKGVLLVPGRKCFGKGIDFKGYVRIGFGQEEQVLKEALQALKEFMEEDFEKVPTVRK